VTKELRRRGYCVNHKRVERLMAENGIVGVTPRRFVRTTLPAKMAPGLDDLVAGDFRQAPRTGVTPATLPMSAREKVGSSSPRSSTSAAAVSPAGPWPTTCAPGSSPAPYGALLPCGDVWRGRVPLGPRKSIFNQVNTGLFASTWACANPQEGRDVF